MSATNRTSVRRAHDGYSTPAWVVHRLLEVLELPGGEWCDPCAGDGAIIRAARACRPVVAWHAVELVGGYRAKLEELKLASLYIGDFLALTPPVEPSWDVILTNPPYALAQQFVEAARKHARYVAMLLRLNFLEGAERASWMRDWMPDVFVLPQRPSFTGEGTDATAYGWFLWEQDVKRSRGLVQLLAMTPKEERRA